MKFQAYFLEKNQISDSKIEFISKNMNETTRYSHNENQVFATKKSILSETDY